MHFEDGGSDRYNVLISTLPLDRLVDLADLKALQECAAGLKYSSSNIIGIGLSGKPPESLTKKCWMYFPEDNCPFYRATVFSHYSRFNVPDPDRQWSSARGHGDREGGRARPRGLRPCAGSPGPSRQRQHASTATASD